MLDSVCSGRTTRSRMTSDTMNQQPTTSVPSVHVTFAE
jgi:hypothetical protein